MTNTQNFYRSGPRQTYEYIVDCFEAGNVPNVIGSPGTGKSSLFRRAAAEFGLFMIDHRVSTSAPEDFTGLPEFTTDPQGVRKASFSPFDLFPLESDPVPAGFEGWLLFLDEANSGTKMVQAAMYKLILDHMTGQKKLHPRVIKAMAGNLMTDRAIVNQMSTAMQSRVVTIEMQVVFDEWLMDVALKEGYDDRIVAFLNFDNKKLMDFRPDHDDKTFCCPRTWEFMNNFMRDRSGNPKEVTDEKTGLYAGTITSGVAAEFVQFCKIYRELVTIREVLRDPNNAPVPQDAQRKWAITSHLMSKVDEQNFGDIATYVNRFDLSFKVLFFRAVMVQHPKLRTHPEFAKAMITLAKYLNP